MIPVSTWTKVPQSSNFLAGYVHIDSESGLITIDPINSDESNGQITFNVTAYEAINPESYITGTILVLFYGNKM